MADQLDQLLEELARRQQQLALNLRANLAGAVGRLWDRFANVDDERAREWLNHTLPVVTGAQQSMVSLTHAGLERSLGLVEGAVAEVAVPALEEVTGAAVRGGATPQDVYWRAIGEARHQLSQGKRWVDAMASGRSVAQRHAVTDLALAQRAVTDSMIDGERIVGYRRVLTGSSCIFCASASTQRYRRGDLMPIHHACDCTVAPIIGPHDPGRVINRKLLGELQHQGGGQYWVKGGIVDEDGNVFIAESRGGQRRRLTPKTKPDADLGPTLDTSGIGRESVGGIKEFSELIGSVTPKAKGRADHVLDLVSQVHGVPAETPSLPSIKQKTSGDSFGLYRRSGHRPVEIEINAESAGGSAFVLSHELGHFLDHQDLGGGVGSFSSQDSPAFEAWRRAVMSSPTVILTGSSRTISAGHKEYLLRGRELWARSYSQWLATKTGDPELLAGLRQMQQRRNSGQWRDEEFGPIAVEVEKVLDTLGLLR